MYKTHDIQKVRLDPGDTLYLTYTDTTGQHHNKIIHCIDDPMEIDKVIIDSPDVAELEKYNLKSGIKIILGR